MAPSAVRTGGHVLMTWQYSHMVRQGNFIPLGEVLLADVEWAITGSNCFQIVLGRSNISLNKKGALVLIGLCIVVGLLFLSFPLIMGSGIMASALATKFKLFRSPGLVVVASIIVSGHLGLPGTNGAFDSAWWRSWAVNFVSSMTSSTLNHKFGEEGQVKLDKELKKAFQDARSLQTDDTTWERVKLELETQAWRNYGEEGRAYAFDYLRDKIMPSSSRASRVNPTSQSIATATLQSILKHENPGSKRWFDKINGNCKRFAKLGANLVQPLNECLEKGEALRRPTSLPQTWLNGTHTKCTSDEAVKRVLTDGPLNTQNRRSREDLPPEAAYAVEMWAACPSEYLSLASKGRYSYKNLNEVQQCAFLWSKCLRNTKPYEIRSRANIDKLFALKERINLDGTSSGEQWIAYVLDISLSPWNASGSRWRDRHCLSVGSDLAANSPAYSLGAIVARHVRTGHDWEVSLEAALRVWADTVRPPDQEHSDLFDEISSKDGEAKWAEKRKKRGLGNIYRVTAWSRRILAKAAAMYVVSRLLSLLVVLFKACIVSLDILFRSFHTLIDPKGNGYYVWARKWDKLLAICGVKPRSTLKTIWTPLFTRERVALTAEEELALLVGASPNSMEPITSGSKGTSEVATLLHKLGGEAGLELSDLILEPTRTPFVPSRARMATHERKLCEGSLLPRFVEDDVVDGRAASLIAKYAKRGIDGTWFASDARVAKSVSRYTVAPCEGTARARAALFKAIDAMEQRWPEMFRNWSITRPEALTRYIKMKYSPGWPFIGAYKSRSELWASGWGLAIAKAANTFLKEGRYPDPTWHAFHKMQVVDGDKLAAGKNVRTVVAQDLTTSFIDHALFLEGSKRPLGKGHDFVLGDVLNEAGLGPHFNAVAKRRKVAGFDATEHDSRLAPILFEGLTELARRGYEWTGNSKLSNMIAQRYARIQSGNIHVLQNGDVVRKLGGGGTGQSRTTRDNTEALEMGLIAGWSVYTGKPATEFWKDNTLRVAGDNGLIGWDDPSFNITEYAKVVRELYGISLGVDVVNQGQALEFLSKLAVPGSRYAEEYTSRKLPVPPLSIIHDPEKLALRRSGMTARLASLPLDQHLRGRLMRTTGHVALVAHQPDWYDRLAHDWMEDVALLLKMEPSANAFIVECNQRGQVIGAHLDPDWRTPSVSVQQNLNWVRSKGTLLSYEDVFKLHLKPQEQDRGYKRHRKVKRLKAATPLAVVFTARIERLGAQVRKVLPSWLARMASDRSIPPLTLASASGDYRLERWLWVMIRERNPSQPVSWTDWENNVRLSPFAGVIDAPGFRYWVNSEGGHDQLLLDSPDSLGGYVIILLATYIGINLARKRFTRGSVFSLITTLFLVYSVDLVRVYSALSIAYWLGTGTASATIAALVPRDPYWVLKRLSHILSSLVPDSVVGIIPWRLMTQWLPGMTKWLSELRLLWPTSRLIKPIAQRQGREKWQQAAKEVVSSWGSPKQVKYISSPTSSGKSTEFIAMLADEVEVQVWLIVPSRFARNTYANPWASCHVHRVPTGGRPSPDAGIVVMTYGQLLAHANFAKEVSPWIALDETHLGTPEQVECTRIFESSKVFHMTATARYDLYPKVGRILNVDVKRGGHVRVITVEGNVQSLIQRALETCKEHDCRMMVQLVGQREAHDIADMLTKGGSPAVAVTRLSREAPDGVHLIGTSVIGVGVNIRPPPKVGVTSGVELLNNRGTTRMHWTTASTHLQQMGRFGRDGKAIFYAPPLAGTGVPATPYPNWRLYTSSMRATAHFNKVYKLSHQLDQTARSSMIRVGAGSDMSYIANSASLSAEHSMTLKALYLFITVSPTRDAALAAYASWKLTGTLGPGCEQLATSLLLVNRNRALNHIGALGLIAGVPYVVRINNSDIRHAGLKLKGMSITRLPRSSAEMR